MRRNVIFFKWKLEGKGNRKGKIRERRKGNGKRTFGRNGKDRQTSQPGMEPGLKELYSFGPWVIHNGNRVGSLERSGFSQWALDDVYVVKWRQSGLICRTNWLVMSPLPVAQWWSISRVCCGYQVRFPTGAFGDFFRFCQSFASHFPSPFPFPFACGILNRYFQQHLPVRFQVDNVHIFHFLSHSCLNSLFPAHQSQAKEF